MLQVEEIAFFYSKLRAVILSVKTDVPKPLCYSIRYFYKLMSCGTYLLQVSLEKEIDDLNGIHLVK